MVNKLDGKAQERPAAFWGFVRGCAVMALTVVPLVACDSGETAAAAGPRADQLVSDLSKSELQTFCKTELKAFGTWTTQPTCATPTDDAGKPIPTDATLQPLKPTVESCIDAPPKCAVGVVKKCWAAWAQDPCTFVKKQGPCAELYDCIVSQTAKSPPGGYQCQDEGGGKWYCTPIHNDHGVYLTIRMVWDPAASNENKGWRVHILRQNDLPWWQDWGKWGLATVTVQWMSYYDPYPRDLAKEMPRETGGVVQWDALHLGPDARYITATVVGYDEYTPWALWSRGLSDVSFDVQSSPLAWQSGDIYLQFHYKPY